MIHLGAFYEALNLAGAMQYIAGVREQVIFVSGDDYRVPEGLAHIIGASAASNNATAPTRAQFSSPSLRSVANLDVEPIVNAATYGSPPEGVYHPQAAIPLVPDEALNFQIEAAADAAPPIHYGLVWLADGVQQPITGKMFSIRATATISQSASAWVNGNMTFSQTLPAGRYAVVGMRGRSTDAVAMRLVFADQTARPGVMVVNAVGDLDPYWFRFGRTGVFGEFPHTIPPTLDVLGGSAAAQVVILDMIRVG